MYSLDIKDEEIGSEKSSTFSMITQLARAKPHT